jgi:regulator of sigma E protease
VFAIIMYTMFSMIGYQALSDPPKIVVASDYPALFSISDDATQVPSAAAGLKSGDIVQSYDGIQIEDFQQLMEHLKTSDGSSAGFSVLRDGERLDYTVTPTKREDGTYWFGISAFIEPVVGSVETDSPESLAGLLPGDTIIAIGGTPVTNKLDLADYLRTTGTDTVALTVVRGNETMVITFLPGLNDGGTSTFNFALHSDIKTVEGMSFSTGFIHSVGQACRLVGNTFASIWAVIAGDEDIRSSFTGPWRASMLIGNITTQGFAESPKAGVRAMLYLLGVVSISLAVANLLPIPALDGGLIMMSVIEILIGRQVSPKAYLILQFIGMGCVLLILGFMTFSDMRFFWLNR